MVKFNPKATLFLNLQQRKLHVIFDNISTMNIFILNVIYMY